METGSTTSSTSTKPSLARLPPIYLKRPIHAEDPSTGSIHNLPRASTPIHVRHLSLASSPHEILEQID